MAGFSTACCALHRRFCVLRDLIERTLASAGIPFECERHLPIAYKGSALKKHLRIDLLIDRRLVVELKAIDAIHLIINFNEPTLTAGARRLDHPAICAC